MTKQEITSYLLSHGWELMRSGNLSLVTTTKSRTGLDILAKFVVRFPNKQRVEIRKEDVSLPTSTDWKTRFPVIACSKIWGVNLREDGAISIGGVVIR